MNMKWWSGVRWPGRALRVGAVVFVAAHVAPAGYLAVTDWPYLVRLAGYNHLRPITDVESYAPLAPVRGALSEPLPPGERGAFDPRALTAAVEIAREQGAAALVVLHRGGVVVEEYFEGDASATTNSMSMAKTVVSLLVGIAIAEGHIESVDDPIARYVPQWGDERSAIRLRHLLAMTAGLRRSAALWNPWSDLVQLFLGGDVIGTALAVPAEERPGTRFRYNNVNTQILALALERATGASLPEYASTRLWQPLGAADAGWWLDGEGGTARAFCCLFARPRDWARVGQMLLQRGVFGGRRVAPEAWIDAMLQPTQVSERYGLHVWLSALHPRRPGEPFDDPRTFRLDGRDHQRVWVVPSAELVIVRVGERAPDWNETILPNTLVRGLRAAGDPSPAALGPAAQER